MDRNKQYLIYLGTRRLNKKRLSPHFKIGNYRVLLLSWHTLPVLKVLSPLLTAIQNCLGLPNKSH